MGGRVQRQSSRNPIQQYRRNSSRNFRGGLEERPLSGQSRTIPINPAMHELCARLLEDKREPRDAKRRGKRYLLKLTECRKALANACAKVGVPKVGHHDLRHLFTTRAIEAQIPIPTVAKWLGHKNGGAAERYLCELTPTRLTRIRRRWRSG
jgi:integrase